MSSRYLKDLRAGDLAVSEKHAAYVVEARGSKATVRYKQGDGTWTTMHCSYDRACQVLDEVLRLFSMGQMFRSRAVRDLPFEFLDETVDALQVALRVEESEKSEDEKLFQEFRSKTAKELEDLA